MARLPKIRRPKSWRALDRVGNIPAPFVALRNKDGSIELAQIDPNRVDRVIDGNLCQMCGLPLDGTSNTSAVSAIVSLAELSCGVAKELPGHFDCLGHATSLCCFLSIEPRIIATCDDMTTVRRPGVEAGSMTVLGGVTHIAIVDKGHVLYDENVEDGREYATLGARMRAELVKASSRDPSSLD